MTIGNQATKATIDNALTQWALNLRNDCEGIGNFFEYVTGLGLTGLEGLGYGSAANPANPGGVSDAQYVLNLASYLNTIAGVYAGTATQATAFNFGSALSAVWGGQ